MFWVMCTHICWKKTAFFYQSGRLFSSGQSTSSYCSPHYVPITTQVGGIATSSSQPGPPSMWFPLFGILKLFFGGQHFHYLELVLLFYKLLSLGLVWMPLIVYKYKYNLFTVQKEKIYFTTSVFLEWSVSTPCGICFWRRSSYGFVRSAVMSTF